MPATVHKTDAAPMAATRAEGAEATAGEGFFNLANSLAHEIRNPLNALALNLDLMARETAEAPRTAALEAARREVRRLNRLLQAFLKYARPRRPRRERRDLAALLSDLETFIRPEAVKRKVALDFLVTPGLTAVVDGDLLKQAVLNLILNSFDASATGIRVTATPGDGVIAVTVADDGPGFAEPHRALEPFYSTKDEGTGLGLPTAAAITRAMGGNLALGRPARGAEVRLTFPAAAVKAAAAS